MPPEEMNRGVSITHTFSGSDLSFAVCDGMGGQNAGERASWLTVQALEENPIHLPSQNPQDTFDQFARTMTRAVWEDGIANNAPGQGTTIALLLLSGSRAFVSNIGDSRVYVLRQQKLFLLSRDHTRIHDQVLAGRLTPEQERNHPDANRITRYIGMLPQNVPSPFMTLRDVALCRGDRFLLCSDGLSDLLRQERIEECLLKYKELSAAAGQLVMEALEAGGKDNVTCIIVDVQGEHYPAPTPLDVANLSLQNSSFITDEITQ